MAVKRSSEEDATVETQPGVEAALLELLRVMPQVIRALKRQGQHQGGIEPNPLAKLFTSGSLGPRHVPVVVAIAVAGPITVTELAHRLGVGVSAASLMVGELARAGVLERHVDELDRRRTLVSISEPYRGGCEQFALERLAPVRRALERMGPDIRAHFLAGWHALAAETGAGGESIDAENQASARPAC
jgi:DNA-binding MarR family transcriptional regulator